MGYCPFCGLGMLACVGRRAGVRGALGWRAWDARQGRAAGVARGRQGARAAGARARGACAAGRAGWAAGALLGARSSRGTGAVRTAMHGLGVAWAPGLTLGCALGALGPFSIRFDSFFS